MANLDAHGVALAVITAHDGLPVIVAQCECGWRASFAEVTTYEAVSGRVNEHHARVLTGAVK